MRVFLHSMVVVCLVAVVFASAQGQGGDATRALAATREALGGDQKLAAVKTFVATGRTRQIRGNNLVPIEFEIACELPDKYVRRDEIPAQESGPTSTGFNADGLIQLPPPQETPPPTARPAVSPASGPPPAANPASRAPAPAAPAPATSSNPATAAPGAANPSAMGSLPSGPPPGRAGGPSAPPPDPRKARVTTLKQDFVRLTLGMFATSFSSYPLTFTLDGQAEAPQGKADIIEVKGAGTFALKFFVNDETHLPIMVSWTMPATNVVLVVPGQPAPENLPPGSIKVDVPPAPSPTATQEEKDKYAKDLQDLRKKALTGAKPVEYRIYYADYRDIGNGLKFPFRLRRAIGTETVEETNFDNFKINSRIDPRKFEVVK
jgi:hypothetical protein